MKETELTELTLKECNSQVKTFISIFTRTLMNFYTIEFNSGDIRKDLLSNLITNFVLTKKVYYIMIHIY